MSGGRIVGCTLALWLVSVAGAAAQEAETSALGSSAAAVPGEEQVLDPAAYAEGTAAVLQGLDKITARISTFEAQVGQPVNFGSLQIIARACDKRPPEEPPESAAFLEIVDVRPDSPEIPIFTGWMFASSPALSAVEHAVYDVWVVDCKKVSSSSSESAEGN